MPVKGSKKTPETPRPPKGPVNPNDPGGAREKPKEPVNPSATGGAQEKPGGAWENADSDRRLLRASNVLTEMVQDSDRGMPEEVLMLAKCVVVVPHLVKGGFVIGRKPTRGVVTCRAAEGWSAPAFISVSGVGWGLQNGVEGTDLIMLVMNVKGVQHLLSGRFQLSDEGAVAAGPVGRHASAGTDWKPSTELLTYSHSHGVFAGIMLEGAVIQQDPESTTEVYGKNVPFRSILLGNVPTPESARQFLRSVSAAVHIGASREVKDDGKR